MRALKALVMILENTKKNTFHPAYYLENPFSGKSNLMRYSLKEYDPAGVVNLEAAKKYVESDLKNKLMDMGYTVKLEIDSLVEWNGVDVPATNQLR